MDLEYWNGYVSNRIEQLCVQLQRFHPNPAPILAALRVPPECHELGSVAIACEPSLTSLCDYFDSEVLLDARDVVRAISRLLQENADLSRNDYTSIESVRAVIDPAYRSLPLHDPIEPWWQATLREALLAHLLISPNLTTINLLAEALHGKLPVSFGLRQPQKSPTVRMLMLGDYLASAVTGKSKLSLALRDCAALLAGLPALRVESLHIENATALTALLNEAEKPSPELSPRERLARVARNIGVAAVAQRREYHSPALQRLPLRETQHELVRRARRWSDAEQTALHAMLLFGRLGSHILQTGNRDPNCHIECQQHNVWVRRSLPDTPEFTHQHEGPGFAPVSREINIPLPRRLGHMFASVASSADSSQMLRKVQKRLRDLSRESGQTISLRRVTRIFDHALDNETPDEALMMLIGLQPQARRDAGIHYFSPDAHAIIERIRSAIERTTTIFDLDALDEGWSTPPRNPQQYFGYSFRADVESIRALLSSLQAFAELGRGRTSSQRIVEAYNARVARLTLMFLAGTGARPTGTVLPARCDFSLQDRAAIVSEKDALSYRSTRLVPLTARFIDEIIDFERWAKAKQLLPRKTDEDSPLLQLRSGDGGHTAPTISALKEIVPTFAEGWLWPDDMFRHLFRSRLWEMGCPSSWLRRVMGHHPPHAATDMPWNARRQWDGLHDWTNAIDEHLKTLGF